MKKVITAAMVLMTVLTVIYVVSVVYANANSGFDVNSSGYGKDPIEYGIRRHYFAEKTETEPEEWYTPEELGIILVESKVIEERYHIFIVDEERALPWMNGTKPMPYAVKYENNFYRIHFLWVTLGLSESAKQWQIPLGATLGTGWVLTGILFKKLAQKTDS